MRRRPPPVSPKSPSKKSKSYLLDVHQESLVLRSSRIGIEHRGTEIVDQGAGDAPDKPPVDRESDLIDDLVPYPKTSHAARDHRLTFDRPARGADPHHVAALNLFLPGQSLGNLDEEMRLQLVVGRYVLGPVVKVFGKTISGPDVGEFLRRAERIEVAAEDLGDRIRADSRMKRILDRRLDRFVMFPKRSLGKVGGIELGDPFGQHDESAESVRTRVGLVVWNVARPACSVPAQKGATGIPRPAGRIGRGAIVKNAAIGRPVPGPVRIESEPRRVFLTSPGHHIAGLGE